MDRTFSERMGFKATRTVAQVGKMDDALRNGLWNVLYTNFFNNNHYESHEYVSRLIWQLYFKRPIDSRPSESAMFNGEYRADLDEVRAHFFGCEWNKVYDFVEFMIGLSSRLDLIKDPSRFIKMLRYVLETECSGYRLLNGIFVPIVDPHELDEVNKALSDSFSESQEHIASALQLMTDRNNPDYRNSIKESISAVEAAARIVSGEPNATLGKALKHLERSGALHAALSGAFSQLYGYTSEADGIRHSLMGESNITQADARYFLMTCSAFVNLLKTKKAS
ncbi:AbiJ-NTD4 domain-containing protein [Xanthomonas albilineans]|uniref:AbiJ-NTD4 domain-containing protein n=1 Tax=Xanthomonas albilineans TaxID=29447 RepID=UPI0005F30091|nr:hypothetical protein [Xanthomonas albilineans]